MFLTLTSSVMSHDEWAVVCLLAMARSMLLDACSVEESPLLSFIGPSKVVQKQFMMGVTGTGAAPHFHGHAANTLVVGRKRWLLWAPAHAFFSIQPVKEWMKHSGALVRLPIPVDLCVWFKGSVLYRIADHACPATLTGCFRTPQVTLYNVSKRQET